MRPVARFALAAVAALALIGAACGGADSDSTTEGPAADPGQSTDAAGTCLAGSPDCQDTGDTTDDPGPPPLPTDDPGDGAFPVEPEPVISLPDGDVAFATPQPWDELRDDGDGLETTHWVTFTSAPAPCTIVDRVEVTETVFSVSIAVFTGPEVGSENVACPAIAEYRAVPVTLDTPIGGRELIDPASIDPDGAPE